MPKHATGYRCKDSAAMLLRRTPAPLTGISDYCGSLAAWNAGRPGNLQKTATLFTAVASP